jgi:hypothetical protein
MSPVLMRDLIRNPPADDVAVLRVAELRASGKEATIRLVWVGRSYRYEVRLPSGALDSVRGDWREAPPPPVEVRDHVEPEVVSGSDGPL